MTDEHLLQGLRRFKEEYFPLYEDEYRKLVTEGQHPTTLFIGCSDSRILPYQLTGTGPGELFIVRNVGNIVPPFSLEFGYHGTCAAIEFAVLSLHVKDIVVCGHSHCGAIRALYQPTLEGSTHLAKWLELAQAAALPVTMSEEVLRRTEQRSVVLQLERLMSYPMVRERVENGELFLHGWHYLIEEGDVTILDVKSGKFVSANPQVLPGT
jgi:carbonic anhydrase